MPSVRGGLAVTAGVIACFALASCSSPASTAQATGQAERAQVLPAARQLYTQVTASGVAYIGSIIGGYEACGQDDPLASPSSATSLQYTASEEMTPFTRDVGFATFKRQVAEALDAAGWQLRTAAGGSAQVSYYTGQRAGFQLRLVEKPLPTFGPTATAYLSGRCFEAGSAARQLTGKGMDYNVSEPSPAAAPTPRYT